MKLIAKGVIAILLLGAVALALATGTITDTAGVVTGWWRSAAHVMSLNLGGTNVAKWTPTEVSVAGQLSANWLRATNGLAVGPTNIIAELATKGSATVTFEAVTNALAAPGDAGKFLTGEGAWAAGTGGSWMSGTVSNAVVSDGLLAVDDTKTNAVAATAAMVTAALGFSPQPTNANLTSWAALAPSAKQDASANLTYLADNGGQPTNANLTSWAALAPSAKQDASANLAYLADNGGQPTNANLTSWAALAPSAKQNASANLTYLADNGGQPTNAVLTTVAGIGAGSSGQVFWHDGTRWTNSAANPFQATNSVLTTVAGIGAGASGQLIWHDGTRWTNSAANPFQATNAALTALAANANLYQATNASLTVVAGVATTSLVWDASTNTLTQKTFDVAGAGNVLKQTKWADFVFPHLCDGTGAVISTNDCTSRSWGHATFSGSQETNANWIEYQWAVPADLDASVDLIATLKVVSGGTDADGLEFRLSMQDVADSADASSTAFVNAIQMQLTPSSPAANDVFTIGPTTLTGWKSALTVGDLLIIRLARYNNSNDDAYTDRILRISYGSTQ